MTDEEKKAIEILKDREHDFDELYCTFRQSFIKPYDKSIGIILELIEKQQKEIERLKDKLNKIYNEIDNKNSQLVKALNYKLFIEDKIKAKIEESELLIDNSQGCMSNEDLYKEFGKIEFGKSLLEEK